MDLSQFDVNFRLFGVPVRIMPSFWLLTLLFSPFLTRTPGGEEQPWIFGAFGWMLAVALSFLFHEFGHALSARKLLGASPSVEFGIGSGRSGAFVFGGITSWSYQRSGLEPWRRVVVSVAGPLAATGASLLFVAIAALCGNSILWSFLYGFLPIPIPVDWMILTKGPTPGALFWGYFVYGFVWIGIVWSAFNLLPIYPLDGSRVSAWIFDGRWGGRRTSYGVSAAVAALLTVFYLSSRQFFMAYMFGFMAYSSYQVYRALS